MTNTDLLSPWVRRFLLEYLVVERNLARNTQKSYRDTLQQFLPFIARGARRRIDRLQVEDLSPDRTRAFLQDVEKTPRLWNQYAKSASCRHSFLGTLHRSARPRTPPLVRADSNHRVQENRAS